MDPTWRVSTDLAIDFPGCLAKYHLFDLKLDAYILHFLHLFFLPKLITLRFPTERLICFVLDANFNLDAYFFDQTKQPIVGNNVPKCIANISSLR